MDPTATTTPSRFPRPVPVAIRADGLGTLPHLVSLVRILIAHGRVLAVTLYQRATDPGFARGARIYGTSDVGIIAICLQRGILRATALCAKLARREARGLDMPNIRMPLPRAPRDPGSAGAPRPGAAGWWQSGALDYLPTQAEIDDEVRRRGVGPLLSDICLDIGIWQDTSPELWADLNTSIVLCGTLTTSLFNEMHIRMGGVDPDVVSKTATLKRWRSAVAAAAAGVAPQPASMTPPAPPPPDQRAAERRPAGSAPRAAAGRSGRSVQFETAPTMHWPVMPDFMEKIAATGAS